MLGDFLTTLKEWIVFLWPFTKLSQWQKGVRETYLPGYYSLTRDHNGTIWIKHVEPRVAMKELGPGMHRKVPWLDEVHDHSIVEGTNSIAVQNLTTKDGRSVTVKVVIVEETFNVMKATLEVHDYESAVTDIVKIYVNRAVRSREWQALLDEQDKVELELKEAIHDRVKKWGVRIKEVGFSTFVQTEQINRFNVNQ